MPEPPMCLEVVHNSAVTSMAMLAWLLGYPYLALHAFCLEIGYEAGLGAPVSEHLFIKVWEPAGISVRDYPT